jgi:hypothetical protein
MRKSKVSAKGGGCPARGGCPFAGGCPASGARFDPNNPLQGTPFDGWLSGPELFQLIPTLNELAPKTDENGEMRRVISEKALHKKPQPEKVVSSTTKHTKTKTGLRSSTVPPKKAQSKVPPRPSQVTESVIGTPVAAGVVEMPRIDEELWVGTWTCSLGEFKIARSLQGGMILDTALTGSQISQEMRVKSSDSLWCSVSGGGIVSLRFQGQPEDPSSHVVMAHFGDLPRQVARKQVAVSRCNSSIEMCESKGFNNSESAVAAAIKSSVPTPVRMTSQSRQSSGISQQPRGVVVSL